MAIRGFKTRLSADFQQCWSNKLEFNPHIYGQGDLFRQGWRERHLSRESKKLPVQLGARQRQVSKTQAQRTLPIPMPFRALPSLDYGSSVQTLEFFHLLPMKLRRALRLFYTDTNTKHISCLEGETCTWAACTHGSPILFIPEMSQSSLVDTDNGFGNLTLFVFSFIIRDF